MKKAGFHRNFNLVLQYLLPSNAKTPSNSKEALKILIRMFFVYPLSFLTKLTILLPTVLVYGTLEVGTSILPT